MKQPCRLELLFPGKPRELRLGIEKFYAAHIKTMLDASAINVLRGTIERERQARQEPVRPEIAARSPGKSRTHPSDMP